MAGRVEKSYVLIKLDPHCAWRSAARLAKSYVGALVGVGVGCSVGDGVGLSDTLGRLVGVTEGVALGADVLVVVGVADGMLLGEVDSLIDGFDEGVAEGFDDAVTEGSDEGDADGSALSVRLGMPEGCSEGTGELGDADGLKEGVADGFELTVTVGSGVGVDDGLADTVGKSDGALEGASVITEAESCPHFPHVLGHAASPLERMPSSAEQYRASLFALFLIQLHFFFFFLPISDDPISALESLQVLSSYVHGLSHVTGQTTAASGVR